jgi:hypothetical protein
MAESSIQSKREDVAHAFWAKVFADWDAIYASIYTSTFDSNAFHERLPAKYKGRVFIDITYGMCNTVPFEAHKDTVSMYLSPAFNRDNVSLVEQLYTAAYENIQPKPSNLIIAKYRMYNANNVLYDGVFNDDAKIKLTDFGYQGSVSYNNEGRPLLNIVVIIKQPIAQKLLHKKTITFKHEDETKTSRVIYMATDQNPIDKILMAIIGEYHVMHDVGYIEMLPSDDPQIVPEAEFINMENLRDQIQFITASRRNKKCNYCEHVEYQLNLTPCDKCNKVAYCCNTCKNADAECHRFICKTA